MNQWVVAGMVFIAFALGARLLLVFAGATLLRFWQTTHEQIQNQLTWLFLFNNASRLAVAYLLCLVFVPMILLVIRVSLPLTLVVVVILLACPRVIFNVLRKRRSKAINLALPDALLQLAAAMRAGATFTLAVQGLTEENTGPLGDELSLMLREHRLGARMDDALDNLAERVQSEEMDLVVSAVLIAQDVGGSLAEVLQGLSETIRRKIELEGKIVALTSQGMLQGYIVSALPLLLLAALSFVEPTATLPIFSSILGWCALGIMACLQLAGAMLIRKIVSIEI